MKQKFGKTLKNRLVIIIFFFSLTLLLIPTPTVFADEGGTADVGITFKHTQDEVLTSSSRENTPSTGKSKPINKRVSLPNTGEMLKPLTFLVSGMLLIVISFSIILDRQIKVGGN
ncbi:cell wall protein [Enterococcus ureasiticus]|uniref:Cell wall protein n=1 Tax=Enterococcus ureasiticus TaxID=903984 RepID=A0A1E5GE96_9ENTE|nr:cell wall protein [Enterococcus ureasiticus]OEG11034.1 cell wall protein [Enterococcus ureasiticus]